MNQGYVKVYRKISQSQVFQNEGLLKVWIWCLIKASHKGRWVSIKTGKSTVEVWIEPGQFIFGRKSAAKELKMHPETVRKRMHKLENMGNLTIQSTSQYSVITIVNWEFYQGDNKKVPSKVPVKYQASTTDKNVKNEKEDIYSEVTKRIIDHLNQVGNRSFTYSKRNLQMIQARLEEGHTEEGCRQVIDTKWNDPDFNKKYFRPSTLFNSDKFEGYLNERAPKRYS